MELPRRTPVDHIIGGLTQDLRSMLEWQLREKNDVSPARVFELAERSVLDAINDEIDTHVRAIFDCPSRLISLLMTAPPREMIAQPCPRYEPAFQAVKNMPAFAPNDPAKECLWPRVFGHVAAYVLEHVLSELNKLGWRSQDPALIEAAKNNVQPVVEQALDFLDVGGRSDGSGVTQSQDFDADGDPHPLEKIERE